MPSTNTFTLKVKLTVAPLVTEIDDGVAEVSLAETVKDCGCGAGVGAGMGAGVGAGVGGVGAGVGGGGMGVGVELAIFAELVGLAEVVAGELGGVGKDLAFGDIVRAQTDPVMISTTTTATSTCTRLLH